LIYDDSIDKITDNKLNYNNNKKEEEEIIIQNNNNNNNNNNYNYTKL